MISNDQLGMQAFRARQYAGPHAAQGTEAAGGSAPQPEQPSRTAMHPAAAAGTAAAAVASEGIVPDTDRVVLHFDADCFYCQVEEVRDPSLRGRPLGVTQKYLVVTCNYAARAHGVTKLMNVAEARRRCPHIVLVSGEDLTPYRAASKQLLAVLQRYGTAEKLGLDEIFVDATAEAKRRLAALSGGGAAAGAAAAGQLPAWHGHVHSSSTPLLQDSRHRPMDLRAVAAPAEAGGGGGAGAPAPQSAALLVANSAVPGDSGATPAHAVGASTAVSIAAPGAKVAISTVTSSSSGGINGSISGWEALLRIGSGIASEARAAVRREAGYRTSAGVACNKILAKLVSGLHKPDDQTVLPPPQAATFVAPLPVRAMPGVGYKMEKELAALGIASAADLRAVPRQQLLRRFGERVGSFLHAACRGKDPSPVVEAGPPKSITVEDSFKGCPGFKAAEQVVQVLAPDLLVRLQEELQEEGRRPATLCVKWRHKGAGWQRSSCSCAMPAGLLSARVPQDQQVAALAAAAMGLLRRHLQEPFDLSLLNLGATGFSEGPAAAAAAAAAAGTRSIVDMLAAGGSGGGGGGGGGGGAPAVGAAGVPAGSVAAGAAAGAPHHQTGDGRYLPPPPQQEPQHAPSAGSAAAAAAAASTQQRRSYSAAAPPGPLLSKRHERQLREQGMQQQRQHWQGLQANAVQPYAHSAWAPAAAPAALAAPGALVTDRAPAGMNWHAEYAALRGDQLAAGHAQQVREAQQAQHGQHGGAQQHALDEEDDASMWADLEGLAAWRSSGGGASSGTGGGGSRKRGPGAAGLPLGGRSQGGGGGSDSMEWQQQQQQQPKQQHGGEAGMQMRTAGSSCLAAGAAGMAVATAAGSSQLPVGGAAGSAAAGGSSSGRVVLHCDVDCFYCQVEQLDDASLRGVPLAVQQFNAGGFVAVNYEARASGIRCGDGAGAAGRASVPHLVRMQAASLEECRRRCPGLQVRPMRTDRYRQVAQQLHALLRTFAPDGQVEKTSYDDFYLDITAACSSSGGSGCGGDGVSGSGSALAAARTLCQQHDTAAAAAGSTPPARLLLIGGAAPSHPQQQKQDAQQGLQHQQQQREQEWQQLPGDLQAGVRLAAAVRSAVLQRLGLVISCGVARNKLVARMASPVGKPDGLAAVPDAAAEPFMCRVPLQKVPYLRGKLGGKVASELGVHSVGDLAAYSRADLVQRYGEQQGAFLAALPLAQDDSPVRERGPQKSLAAERSFPPLPSEAAAAAELVPLARTLLERAVQDAHENCRLPSRLIISYRQGYHSNPRSKSTAVPPAVLRHLQAALQGTAPPPPCIAAVAEAEEDCQQPAAAAAHMEQQQQQQALPPASRQDRTNTAAVAGAVVAAALALLRPAVAASGWQLTRLAVALGYDDAGSSGGGGSGSGGHQAAVAGQQGIAAFLQKGSSGVKQEDAPALPVPPAQQQEAAAAGSMELAAAGQDPAAAAPGPQQKQQGRLDGQPMLGLSTPHPIQPPSEKWQFVPQQQPTAQQQQQQSPPTQQLLPAQRQQQASHLPTQHTSCHQQQASRQQQQQPDVAVPQQPAKPTKPASYRNAEALALQQLFGGASGSPLDSAASAMAAAAAHPGGSSSSGGSTQLSEDEKASWALALRLQKEEAQAAATTLAARKRGAAAAATGGGGGGRGSKQKQQRRRGSSGPLDAFLQRKQS